MEEKNPCHPQNSKELSECWKHTKWEDGGKYLVNEPSKEKERKGAKRGRRLTKMVTVLPGGIDPSSFSKSLSRGRGGVGQAGCGLHF